ncbi:MAG: hypothetical protein SF066_06880 [Thermoanaerobaculia bacterium]|nr:hypothetical protein [Thermoanaerobaculia bacterium]
MKTLSPSLRIAGRGGVPVIPRPTPLTRLHYFDGKFLRASDLTLEQEYHRQLVQFSNQAGGSGVVHGFDAVWTGGDALALGPGLALDPQGRTLFLPEGVPLSLGELVEASRGGAVLISGGQPRAIRFAGFADCQPLGADGGVATTDGGVLYLVSLFHAEDLCGEEDVLGRLCADPCAKTIERPYILEGVLVRAVPITLETALATSATVARTGKPLRSLTAAAYFEDERRAGGSLISGDGLRADAWCLGAGAQGGAGVPVGLFSRAGETIRFFDAWTARRERIEPPNRRYWAGRMAMRPWDVFLAQVLQFQCQLTDCLGHQTEPGGEDDCAPAYRLLRETSERFSRWLDQGGLADRLEEVTLLRGQLVDAVAGFAAKPRERLLISCGIVELPSAGYLPVVPSASLSVNQQVRRMMGEGVDLRFCVVRPDFVPHALEEAQHMERISLLAGLDDPAKKPRVDILVPDGLIDAAPGRAPGTGYVVDFGLASGLVGAFEELFDDTGFEETIGGAASVRPRAFAVKDDAESLFGAGRGEDLAGGGAAFHFAGRTTSVGGRADTPATLWLTVATDLDPFSLPRAAETRLEAEAVHQRTVPGGNGQLETRTLEITLHGRLLVEDTREGRVSARVAGRLTVVGHPPTGNPLTRSLTVQESVLLENQGSGKVTVAIPGLQLFFGGRAQVRASREWPEAGRARVEGAAVASPRDASDLGRLERQIEALTRQLIAEGVPAAEARQRAEAQLGVASRREIPLFVLDQRVSDEVVRPDHTAHVAALASLQRLAKSLGDADFLAARARKLFPPAAPATTDLTVKATRDWVFFHRRRDKTCGIDAVKPTVPSRRYRVFHVEVDRHEEQEILLGLLRRGIGLDNYNPEEVGTVEYAGGSPALETSQPLARQAWDSATADGNRLLLGVLASHPETEAEGEVLADSRLDTLTGLYTSVTPLADAAHFEVLDDLPAGLSAAGVDGVMVFVTLRPSQAVECHSAYLLRDTSLERLLPIHERIATVGFSEDLFANTGAVLLGSAGFVEGSANLAPNGADAVAAAFKTHVPTIPNGLTLIALSVSQFDRTTVQADTHFDQTEAIAKTLGGRRLGKALRAGGDPRPLPFGCPAVTILALVKTAEIPGGGSTPLVTGGGRRRRGPG